MTITRLTTTDHPLRRPPPPPSLPAATDLSSKCKLSLRTQKFQIMGENPQISDYANNPQICSIHPDLHQQFNTGTQIRPKKSELTQEIADI